MDKKGVVRTVSGNTCTVYLYDEKRDVSVSINNVDPGEPVKQDKVCRLSFLTSYLELILFSCNANSSFNPVCKKALIFELGLNDGASRHKFG